MATSKQILRCVQNARNARLSTGPRTAEGRKVAAANSLRHGMLSTLRVLPDVEDEAEWQEHLEKTRGAIQPQGYVEELLTERLALQAWRLRRVARFEQAILAQPQVEASQRIALLRADLRATEKEHTSRFAEEVMFAAIMVENPEESVSEHRATSIILRFAELSGVQVAYGPGDSRTVCIPQHPPDQPCTKEYIQRCIKLILERLNKRLEAVLWHAVSEVEEKRQALADELDRALQSTVLPNTDDFDRISRYDTSIERSLHKTLHELQRLQAARLGMPHSPPVAVDVEIHAEP